MGYQLQLTQMSDYCRITYPAMASLCELLIDTDDAALALNLGQRALTETQRIEQKFSRYRDDNVVARINSAAGQTVTVDDETAALLDFAQTLWELSEGRFDITSGVLREIWTFDGSDQIPSEADVATLLNRIGWDKVHWQPPELTLGDAMEIDLGGIGKEYAVDKVTDLLSQQWSGAILINFGGDLRCTGQRRNGEGWQVGIEKVSASAEQTFIEMKEGGLATSGDQKRYLKKDGQRYCHILDPRTGWPVKEAPHSITAIAPTCLQAGMYSSLAMLMGSDAEAFLETQGVRFWSLR